MPLDPLQFACMWFAQDTQEVLEALSTDRAKGPAMSSQQDMCMTDMEKRVLEAQEVQHACFYDPTPPKLIWSYIKILFSMMG